MLKALFGPCYSSQDRVVGAIRHKTESSGSVIGFGGPVLSYSTAMGSCESGSRCCRNRQVTVYDWNRKAASSLKIA